MDGNDSQDGSLSILVWLLLLSLHALCRAQRITIRLIDVKESVSTAESTGLAFPTL